MKIYADNELLAIPIWITASSSSCAIQEQAVAVNDRNGKTAHGSTHYSVRTFHCSGVIPAGTHEAVEQERSRITALLAGKELTVFKADLDTISYRCRLTGNVQTGYHTGKTIGTAFTINFTLTAYDPFGYGEKKTHTFQGGEKTVTVTSAGNRPELPAVTIRGVSFVEGLILECGSSYMEAAKRITIPSGKALQFKDGRLFLDGNDISKSLSTRSLIKPLMLQAGTNAVKLHTQGGTVEITVCGRYA